MRCWAVPVEEAGAPEQETVGQPRLQTEEITAKTKEGSAEENSHGEGNHCKLNTSVCQLDLQISTAERWHKYQEASPDT